jgi:hypothetical protein
MIRFVIWATLKDYLRWRPTEVMGGHDSDYRRWQAMKEAYKKDYSFYAFVKNELKKQEEAE